MVEGNSDENEDEYLDEEEDGEEYEDEDDFEEGEEDEDFAKHLRAAGVEVEFHLRHGAPHGFELVTPELVARVLQGEFHPSLRRSGS